MKNVVVVYTWGISNNVFGGIKTILESYIKNQDLFLSLGYNPQYFNYKPELVGKYGKLGHMIYAIRQQRALSRYLMSVESSIVHIHTSRDFLFMKDIALARMIRKRFGIPVVITIHVGSIVTVFSKTKLFKGWLINLCNKYLNKFVFLTESIRAEFISEGLEDNKTTVLYNFHNLEPLLSKPNEDASRNTLKLIFVGAIHREKGILDLLQAIKMVHHLDIHLDICGTVKDSSILKEFEQTIKELGSVVSMRGLVRGIEKTLLFEQADVLVLPSYHEGMPMVVLEALSAKCAIISTRVGGTPEILDDTNAYWIDIQSPSQIAEAIGFFYNNRIALSKMKESNLLLSERFSIQSNIENLCDVYESVVVNY